MCTTSMSQELQDEYDCDDDNDSALSVLAQNDHSLRTPPVPCHNIITPGIYACRVIIGNYDGYSNNSSQNAYLRKTHS